MDTPILVSLVGRLGTVVAAALTYWTTKKRERDSEWRKEKLIYYKALVESLGGIIEGDDTPDGHRAFASTTNNLLIFVPQAVIDAANAFRAEIRISNPVRSRERHDELLACMLLAVRRDIGVFQQTKLQLSRLLSGNRVQLKNLRTKSSASLT